MADKNALVLEGGGSRGMFTAGILDSFLINSINFDAVYGVSAGALYGASFVSKQMGRNVKLNKFIGDKRYGGFMHLLRSGSYFSWDFIYGELAHEILPYDYQTFRNSTDFYVGVSNCHTGKPVFFHTNELEKSAYIDLLTATGSLPFISPTVHYKGEEYLDGGMTASIPYEIALEQGADKVVVVLTRPDGYVKSEMKFQQIAKWYYRKYPMVYKALRDRAQHYNESLQKLKELEKNGRAYLIYPKEELAVSRVEKDPVKTEAIYHEAMNDSKGIIPKLENWMSKDE
ncbi:MAG: patatin family protein [Bacteroidota bacterium]